MMEHVMMFDWCTSGNERYFVEESDIDNCTTEKILRNKFVDPLLSSDSEDDNTPKKINWDQIFKNKPIQNSKSYVPCLRQPPHYPKLSELTSRQHIQFLKIMSVENPNILESLFLGQPTSQDFNAFESAKETYLKEQKAYIEWAKTLWTTDHCIRALRPKPDVESVYEAEFEVRAQRLRTFPKYFDVAAQISLENRRSNSDIVLKQDLIRVTLAEMPQVQFPEKIEQQFNIIRPYIAPEPCQKHPYQIILPNEDALSMLPITEIHRELAIFALNNGTQYIASENSLKCLTQWNRHWLMPLSVCDTIGPDGNRVNVIVLDSEFSVHKETAPMRTYKAFRHLLENAVIPKSEKERIWQIRKTRSKKKAKASLAPLKCGLSADVEQDVAMASDDEDSNHLVIDTGEDVTMTPVQSSSGFSSPKAGFGFASPINGFYSPKSPGLSSPKSPGFGSPKSPGLVSPKSPGLSSPKSPGFSSPKAGFSSTNNGLFSPKSPGFGSPKSPGLVSPKSPGFSSPQATQSNGQNLRRSGRIAHQEGTGCLTRSASRKMSEESQDFGMYNCTCKGTVYEKPPRRSFRKWQFRNKSTNEKTDIVIHSPHKAKDKSSELILEPIPEYQIDLGASEQTPDALRSAALSLALRKHASLLNARVDGPTGDVVLFEKITSEAFVKRYPDLTRQVISTVHTVLSQLQGLLPGHYLLQHEPIHGANAMLMSPRAPSSPHKLHLNFDSSRLIELDEAHMAKQPPTISTVLLPYHKHRRVLPCAFTPYENQVAKETKKPQPKKKPPQAIKFPKRKPRKRGQRW